MELSTREIVAESARRFVAYGRAQGRRDGMASLLIKQFNTKFGAPSDAVRERFRVATANNLEHWATRIIRAAALEGVFEPLGTSSAAPSREGLLISRYGFQSEFAKCNAERGRVLGRGEGMVGILLKQLTLKFGPCCETWGAQVSGASEHNLERWAQRTLFATDITEVFARD
jgi:hypothetical protein